MTEGGGEGVPSLEEASEQVDEEELKCPTNSPVNGFTEIKETF